MPAESILEQFRLHDFIAWNEAGELILNPAFQRRSVWQPQAKVLLIDTILRRMPVPKIYMRTQINARTKRSVREIVDGQQRLRAILEFANDDLVLTRRAGEFAGLRYSSLDEDLQQEFLAYPLAVDQLLNATDTDVLDVFARLNSYTVSLNAAEKRHAKYQGDFKWAVHNAAKGWRVLWEDFRIVTGRDRLRMGDDSLMAEMYGVLLQGVTDGGATQIDRLYRKYDEEFPEEEETRQRLDRVLGYLTDRLGDGVRNTPLRRGPQFLMLFAAIAHALEGIPDGLVRDMPQGPLRSLDLGTCRGGLAQLADALEEEDPPAAYEDFVAASKGSTQRIATRAVRFRYYWAAINGERAPRL